MVGFMFSLREILAFDLALEALVETDVEDAGLGARLGLEHLELAAGGLHAPAQFALGVVQVAEDARAADAGFDAGRQQPGVETMAAEGALVRLAGLVVDEARVVGAGLHAVGAADAALAVDQHEAVGALEGGADRADRDARRIVAVVAQARQDVGAGRLRGVVGLLDAVGRNDGAEAALGHRVLVDAGDGAGLAADALAHIDEHAPVRAGLRARRFRQGGGGDGAHGEDRNPAQEGAPRGGHAFCAGMGVRGGNGRFAAAVSHLFHGNTPWFKACCQIRRAIPLPP